MNYMQIHILSHLPVVRSMSHYR